MMLGFALLTITAYSQLTKKQTQWLFAHCGFYESYDQCKARFRREKIEEQRRKDSIDRLSKARTNARERAQWEADKERRSKLTPEERQKEDEEKQQHQQEKKVNKTGKSIDGWAQIFAALNWSTKTGSDPAYTPALGIQFGVHTQLMNLSDDIGLGIGAAYSMQGGKYKSYDYIPGGEYGTSSASSRLNYLNFPVLVRYQRQRHGFFAEAGVQPGLLLSAKDKGNDIKGELKKFDLGIPVGVGYSFKNKFGVGLRVTPGLLNVNKDSQYKNRNMVASLRASYAL